VNKHYAAAYLMIMPALVLIALLWFVPMGVIGGLSLHRSDLLRTSWVGVQNYVKMVQDHRWQMALGNSAFFSGCMILSSVVLAAFISLSASSLPKHWRAAVRIAFYIPALAAGIIISQVWLWVFKPLGVADWLVKLVGLTPPRWLGERFVALPVIITVVVGSNMGACVVVIMACLETIPRELHEAAQMDGARILTMWWHVDIPWVARTLALLAFTALVAGTTIWETPYMLTRGGPEGATASLVYAAWEQAFVKQQYGMAAAQCLTIVLLVTGVTVLARRLKR